jgi:hypothetical protein
MASCFDAVYTQNKPSDSLFFASNTFEQYSVYWRRSALCIFAKGADGDIYL